LGRWRLAHIDEVRLERIIRRNQRCEDRDQHKDADNDGARDGRVVLGEFGELAAERALLDMRDSGHAASLNRGLTTM
jgi:hypothetical protein